ncbi:MAG: RsmB/NOP family class I SAM-dependent RNA methyltransferase [Candidatus Kapaibacteriales bacterium]
MEFETLLKHSAEVINVILKSSASEDEIISKYFRAKKYIGSKERKIISEIVFLYLRFKKLAEYIFSQLYDNNKIRRSNKDNSSDLIGQVLTTIFICLLKYPENLARIYKLITEHYKIQQANEYLQKFIIDYFLKFFSLDIKKILYSQKVIHFNNIDFVKALAQKSFKNSKLFQENIELASIRYSIPKFILESWLRYYEPKGIDCISLAESLLFPAQITLRINPMFQGREEIKNLLLEQGIESTPTIYSPFGLNIDKRINLHENKLYKSGLIEVQDEGSQLICLATNPNEEDKILDACAGAGGKALLLAQMQKDRGKIIANDINFLKLKELLKRAKRAKLNSIQIHHQSKENKLNLKFDIVLVDVPCSGIGTARRNPMHKWKLSPYRLEKISRKQLELLQFYSNFVRKNGTLVYSTCSLMPEENEIVIQKFLKKNKDFEPFPFKEDFNKFKIKLGEINDDDYMLTLLPSVHKTDGFFICKLRKIK